MQTGVSTNTELKEVNEGEMQYMQYIQGRSQVQHPIPNNMPNE